MNNKNKVVITTRGIILNDNKLFLVKHPVNDFYCLPGGTLEYDEDIKDCLSREMVEELGVSPKIGRLLYINSFLTEEKTQVVDFLFEILNGEDFVDTENKHKTHSHEIEEVIWLSKNQNIKVLPERLKIDFDNNELLSNTVRFIKE